MDISIIKGSRRWSAAEWTQGPESQAVLFLADGRCTAGTDEYSAPVAVPFSPAEFSELILTDAQAVIFPVYGNPPSPVIPDRLSLEIIRETFFENFRTAEHQRAAVQLVIFQLAGCEPLAELPDSAELAERVFMFMKSHLGESLDLDQLCRHFSCSKSGLLAAFKRRGRLAPMKELAQLRAERACELLKENELTVSQIARAVGYEDLSAFNHFFSRHMKSSPRDYRENCLWLA